MVTYNLIATYEWITDSFQNASEDLSIKEQERFVNFTANHFTIFRESQNTM